MTADYTYDPGLVFNPETSSVIRNETGGQLYAQTTDVSPVTIYDLLGNVITELVTNELGLCLPFKAGIPMGYVKFGDLFQSVISYEAQVSGTQAAAAQAAAEAAEANAEAAAASAASAAEAAQQAQNGVPLGGVPDVDILWAGAEGPKWAPPPTSTGGGGVGGTVDWDTGITNKPASFPPDPHRHPSTDITDATAVGRAVLSATDAQAARTAIGAGAPVTGFPGFGTTSTTAARGDHIHSASSIPFNPAGGITATDVQTAIAQAAQLGGGGGTSATLVWRYTAGAWPALPATQPPGVQVILAYGPAQPTVVPSWTGKAAGKVPIAFSKVDVA